MLASLLRVAAGLVGVYAAYAAAGFLFQRAVLFPGVGAAGRGDAPEDAQVVWLRGDGADVEAWFLPPLVAEQASGPAPVLLFAHGNAELIDDWPRELAFLREAGLALLLVEYPGYGRSTGVPTRVSVARAIAQALRWLRGHPRVDPSRIVLYGRSLGGAAVCTQLAQRPAAVVLQSTFLSLVPFARAMFLPPFLVRDRFDNGAALAAYDGPALVLHGRLDDVIPFWHGRALGRAARHARFVALECAHNDCLPSDPALSGEILAFFREHGLLRPTSGGGETFRGNP